MSKKVTVKVSKASRNRVKFYLKLLMQIKHTTVTQTAQSMGYHKSYISTSIDTLNINPLTKMLKHVSQFLNIPNNNLLKVLKGNSLLLQKAEQTCAQKIGTPYLKMLMKRYNVSKDDIKNKLSGSEYDAMVLNARPNPSTIVKLSKMLYTSPLTLGTRFGYRNSAIQKALNETGHAINKKLVTLRHANHLSQKQVAKSLGVYQTAVSGYEKQHYPHLATIFKLAKLYKASPMQLIKLLPGYSELQSKSPAYKLMILCDKRNTNGVNLVQKAGLSGYVSTDIFRKEQRNSDRMIDTVANTLIKTYHLPTDYFGKTESKSTRRLGKYLKKAKKIHMKKDYFGYKVSIGMIKRNITLRDLAKRTGMTYQRIQQITRFRKKMPTPALKRKITDALHSFD